MIKKQLGTIVILNAEPQRVMSFKELKEREQRMPKAFSGGVGAGPVPARYPQALCPLKAALLLSDNSNYPRKTPHLCVSAFN